MKTIAITLLLLTVCSCATRRMVYEPNRNLWVGRSADDILIHPLFAIMPMESRKTDQGLEIRTFRNGGFTQSSANCYKGQCNGMSQDVACSHIFYVENKLVSDYKRAGQCAREQLQYRPLDKNDNPLFTEQEVQQFNSGRSTASEKSCGVLGKVIGC